MNLEPCPCGKIPTSIHIMDNNSKWAWAYPDCCGEWHIEFRTGYHDIDSDEARELAIEAWNTAPRGK